MRVIRKNVEALLYQDIKSLWEDASSSRSVYFRFSTLQADLSELHSAFVDLCSKLFPLDISSIYICHDGDVFLISDSFTQRHVNKIMSALSGFGSDVGSKGNLTSIAEIRVSWNHLREVLIAKIDHYKIYQERLLRQKKAEVKKVSRETTFNTLDKDLISSLSMRREMRDTAVVMVVEDDPFTQKLVSNSLGKGDYDLEVSGDGQGAIMMYVNKAPDILFLDIGLPDIDGHDVLKKLFEIDPSAFVVMFSGNGDRDNVMKAIELGAKGFVGKPFTKDKLFQYINKSPFIQSKKRKGE